MTSISIPTVSIPTVSNTLEVNTYDGIPLTLDRYTYLYRNMERAKAANKSGKLSSQSWELLRSRFAEVHKIAISIYGADTLNRALTSKGDEKANTGNKTAKKESATVMTTNVPMIVSGDNDPEPRSIFQITPSDYAKSIVNDQLISNAISLSWTIEQLTGTTGRLRFPIGDGYGLICFIDNNDKIMEVTERYITIVNRNNNKLRFYNKNIKQTWQTWEV